ncbi:sugar ABC transporter ATP-binding protein [Bauldia sp.]|uniref:sugar ABC transporter ATP-binding protein n=1 Tax=Bauldia sp. TaxID=2575872 RepID=UPI003BA95782
MTGTAAAPLLKLDSIVKSFPGVKALRDISFTLNPGEVHVLLGENGAGKSTLVKILSGIYQPDSGTITIGDTTVPGLTPETAHELGIGHVHQELCLVPALSVSENLFLNAMPKTPLGRIDWREANRRAAESLEALGVVIDPSRAVRDLEVAEQQLVEIARVLNGEPSILLLDEPTSALSDSEKHRLFEVVRTLRQRGVGIVYISHHLSEVQEIGDRVTVLRDGQVVDTIPASAADRSTIVRMMVGHDLSDQFPKSTTQHGQPSLEVNGLTAEPRLHDISFSLHKGEILGVYGLMGAGQADLARVLFGLSATDSGVVAIDGKPVTIASPADAIALGMGLISRDRRQSLVPLFAVGPNISLAWLATRPVWSVLEGKRERSEALRYITDLSIEPPLPTREVMYFSGGNQQKIVLARWMSSQSGILIFDEPTRGIDVGAKADVFALMTRLAEEGAAILMISSEPAELEGMADRVLIMRAGRIVAALTDDEISQEALLRLAS